MDARILLGRVREWRAQVVSHRSALGQRRRVYAFCLFSFFCLFSRFSRRGRGAAVAAQLSDREVDAEGLRRQGAVWALCVFGAGLFALSELTAPRRDSAAIVGCDLPRGVAEERGFTRVVACGPQAGGGEPIRGPARWLFGLRIDVNSAHPRLLEALPGIGPARASEIVAERRRRAFASIEGLTRVHGVGPKTVERLRPFVRVDPSRPSPAESAFADGEG